MYTNSVDYTNSVMYTNFSNGSVTSSVWVCTQYVSMGMYTTQYAFVLLLYGFLHKLSMGLYTNSLWVCTQTQSGLSEGQTCPPDKSTLKLTGLE